MNVAWPIAIENPSTAVAGTVLWRHVGRLNLTVVVKATFSLEDGVACPVIAEDLVTAERFQQNSGSLLHDVDIAPHKPRAEVTFVGRAWPASPATQTTVRLAVDGATAGLDKSLQVIGDRSGPNQQPAPFRSMPLLWERAWGDGLANPIGVPQNQGRWPNVFAPGDPNSPAGLGPLARAWNARLRFVGRSDPQRLQGPRPEMPNDISWGFFLAAPADQQLGRLRGDEQLVLEGLIEGRPSVRSRLPGAKGTARLFGPTANGSAIELKLDTIVIEGDRQLVSLVWRGTTPFADEAAAARSKVVIGLELAAGQPGQRSAPADAPPATQRVAHQPAQSFPGAREPKTMQVGQKLVDLPKLHQDGAAVFDLDEPESEGNSTMAIDPDAAMRMIANARGALPFGMFPPSGVAGGLPAPPPPPPAPPPPAPPPPAPPPPPAAPPPPAPAIAPPLVAPGVSGTMPSPPMVPASPAKPAAARADVVVRASPTYAIEDEDSIGSTMAITPEAAAELLARRAPPAAGVAGANSSPHAPAPIATPGPAQPRAHSPQAPIFETPHPARAEHPARDHAARPAAKTSPPNLPPPAPPPPLPGELGRHGTMEMEAVPDSDETGGGTMVLQAPEGVPLPGAQKRR